ncbi:MAG: hypothetical protein QG667_582 [Pseudomonadota bacterium]|jgi:hypothetical protein|nr:hypothetical protein [Pseudomonadota bacterium]
MSVPVIVMIQDSSWQMLVMEHLASAGIGAVAVADSAQLVRHVSEAQDKVVCIIEHDAHGFGRRMFAELLRQGKGAVPVIFNIDSAVDAEVSQRLLLNGALAVLPKNIAQLPSLVRMVLHAIDLRYWHYEETQPWSAMAVSKLNRIRDIIMYECYRARASGDARKLHTLQDIDVALEAILAMDVFNPWHAVVAVDRYDGNLTAWGRLAMLLASSLGLALPAKQDVLPYIRRCFPSREYVRPDTVSLG